MQSPIKVYGLSEEREMDREVFVGGKDRRGGQESSSRRPGEANESREAHCFSETIATGPG